MSLPAGTAPVDVDAATGAVLIQSVELPESTPQVRGPNFENGVDYDSLFENMCNMGFQASALGEAIKEVQRMIKWRLIDEPLPEGETEAEQPVDRSKVKCTIMLAYTSNMISSGVREVICYLTKHKMIDCLITTCGGIEEDAMKCLAPHYIGSWHGQSGVALRKQGLNRIGNLLVPNKNYVLFEEFLTPILDDMLAEQNKHNRFFTPSDLIARMGKAINNEESIYYWAWKNDIPVFSPAITDGSIGDMIFFHAAQGERGEQKLIIDIAADICKLNELALLADHSGQIILGGGVPKHHCCNANLMRNGADYSVYINTGIEYDGSDAGASPDEAQSWGKIRLDAKPVKVWGEATIMFPILVAQTFVKHHENSPSRRKEETAKQAAK